MSFRPTCHPVQGTDLRSRLNVLIDGTPAVARAGDTILSFLLRERGAVRKAEFGDGSRLRAGFCAMGACQDCWVSLSDGRRMRACSTLVEQGMHFVTGFDHGAQ